MTYNELAELFKREGGDAQVCFGVISQNQILFGNNDTKKDIISFRNDEPIKWVKEAQEEPVSIWHDASEEPDDISHCLIFYGCAESVGHYLHYEPVLYNKKEKAFVTKVYPHPTGYKIEQKSVDGGCVAEVYKDKRDRISISDITRWCYLEDLYNLSNLVRIGKNWKEPVSEELDEAAWAYYDKNKPLMPQELALHREFVSFFKAGAQWREEQMMAKAVDADCFGFQGAALFSFRLPACNYLIGSKVKVIVIKED